VVIAVTELGSTGTSAKLFVAPAIRYIIDEDQRRAEERALASLIVAVGAIHRRSGDWEMIGRSLRSFAVPHYS
jgi:hypothetical protein